MKVQSSPYSASVLALAVAIELLCRFGAACEKVRLRVPRVVWRDHAPQLRRAAQAIEHLVSGL